MKISYFNESIAEAERFLKAAHEARTKSIEKKWRYMFYPCKEAAAVKRASMDLSRALSNMRCSKRIDRD